MTAATEFAGPGPDVFQNILALNSAYLDLRHDLKGPQKGRMAATPFLLFSLRENDLDWWQCALVDEPQRQLLSEHQVSDADTYALQTAAIGVMWQQARENPYVARLISGASIAWCDMLADLPLLNLLDRAGRRADLLQSRWHESSDAYHRLATAGVSSRGALRRAAHIAALQDLLTAPKNPKPARLAAAACRMPSSARSVAEKEGVT